MRRPAALCRVGARERNLRRRLDVPKDEAKKKSEHTIVCPHCHAVLDEFFMLELAMVPAMKACPSCGTYVSAQGSAR
jgi:hypothetical protein